MPAAAQIMNVVVLSARGAMTGVGTPGPFPGTAPLS